MSLLANRFPQIAPNIPGYAIVEQLYLGSHTAVYRAVQTQQQQPVILKVLRHEYPSFGELVQFRNQYTIAKNLPIPGIIYPISLEAVGSSYALVMEDWGGIALSNYTQQQSLELVDLLSIAIQLANILHDLAQYRVIHKDIKPANILIHPETKQVKLIDFSIASLLPKETQEIQNPNILEGTLAYMAPEQTGRMNRGIDYRADFYALGVTLYQLLSGTLPFDTEDSLELIHSHIARVAMPIHQVNPAVPKAVSAIVDKLMAKNAEDRYQSAKGLKHDLEQCLNQWQTTGAIPSIELGQQDWSDRFLIPEKLYGRDIEVKTLLAAFDRVAEGTSELMLVAGFSGIGKTAIVNEVHKPIVRQRGYFIKSKYDQFNRDIPLSAFVLALQDLMGQLLSESDTQLQQWKTKILNAVGENGQVLIDVIPDLEQIIGSQPVIPELSGSAVQNRFNRLFQKFIAVFTTAEHPLVIFLDDLQWADSASLQMIKLLMNDNSYLLVLGAYRDNEIFPVHPFMMMVNELQQAQVTVNTVTLAPLTFSDTNDLVADTLYCPPKLAQPLTELIERKTKGNPFFITQFLKTLHEDGYIRFNHKLRHWECDIAQVNILALTDDVVEFMVMQLQKLPVETQHVLKLAACIGNQFDLATLALVSEYSHTNAATALWEASQEGLILPTNQAYKFFHTEDEEAFNSDEACNLTYRFSHDRIQQAAYYLIPEDQKKSTHLKIGRILLESDSENQVKKNIFSIINQLNFGKDLVTSINERATLAQINLIASRKAKASTAYQSALDYAKIGLSLITSNNWQSHPDLTLNLYSNAAKIALLCGEFSQMETWIEIILERDIELLKKVPAYQTQISARVAQSQTIEAIEIGLQVLKLLGIEFPETPSLNHFNQGLKSTQAILAGKDISELLDLEPMQAQEKIAALEILDKISASAYNSNQILYPLLVFQQINLSLQYGNHITSISGYLNYGLLLCALAGEIETGCAFGKLALTLIDKLDAKSFSAKAATIVGGFLRFYKESVRDTLPLFKSGYSSGLETGDLEYAAYCAFLSSAHFYLSGQELSVVREEIVLSAQAIENCHQEHPLHKTSVFYQTVLNLQGEAEDPCNLIGAAYNESLMMTQHEQMGDFSTIYYAYFNKLILCYLLGEYEQAQQNAVLAQQYSDNARGLLIIPVFCFYESLSLLALWPKGKDRKTEIDILEKVGDNQTYLQKLAAHCPTNFQHKYNLVNAEKHRVLGQKTEAIELYDRAIAGAKANGYIQEEALANELAAKFYLAWGKEKIAAGYMQEAYYRYIRWGAQAKVADLESRYPDLLRPILQQANAAGSVLDTLMTIASPTMSAQDSTHQSSSSTNLNQSLDFAAILKASQALSSTIQLDDLLHKLTQIILQNSGGDRCALVMPDETGKWQVRAIATPDDTQLYTESLTDNPNVPVKLIQYVKNTQEAIVIDDLETNLPVIDDYLRQRQPKSLLCMPILNQGHLIGIVYLKNHLTHGVFTEERILVLNFLCTQAAIALENARLYQQEQQKSEEIAQREAEYRSIFESVTDGLLITDLATGETVAVNPTMCQMHGYSQEEWFTLQPSDFIHPDYLHDVHCEMQNFMETLNRGEEFYGQGMNLHKNGSPLEVEVKSIPFIYQGKSCGLSIVRDISERKRAEEAILQKSQALETALTELQHTQLQLVQSEKMSALGGLVSGVAHEINNPVGCIIGNVGATRDYINDLLGLLDRYGQQFPEPGADIEAELEAVDLDYVREDLPRLICAMKDSGDRIKSISRSLRTFSRADTETRQVFDLCEGIESTLLILRHRLKANEQRPAIEVVTDYGNIPDIACFPGQLNQVFMNILANAIDALDEASQNQRYAELEANPQRIMIRTGVEDNWVAVVISDNGPGISDTIKAKIFDHLFTTKEVGKGTGLGLAIARQIVVGTHGGTLEVQSEVSQGTEFYIRLPF